MTIHFICRGNAHRSLMAEAYLKSLQLKDVDVLSSGTVANTYRSENEPRIPKIIARLDTYGKGQFAKTSPDQLTQERIDRGDITVCMNQIVVDECSRLVTMPKNTLTWDITDVGEGKRTLNPGDDALKYFDEIYEEIARKVNELVRTAGLAVR